VVLGGVGECDRTVDNCVDGAEATSVVPGTASCVPGTAVDEDLSTTTCGVGECERTIDNCVDGAEVPCVRWT
jgi:hypothetical protein